MILMKNFLTFFREWTVYRKNKNNLSALKWVEIAKNAENFHV